MMLTLSTSDVLMHIAFQDLEGSSCKSS